MSTPACSPDRPGANAWERNLRAWELFLPLALAASVVLSFVNGERSGAVLAATAVGALALAAWGHLLRPGDPRAEGPRWRGLIWGLGLVVGWLALVLVDPGYYLALSAVFAIVFARLRLPVATVVVGVLAVAIAFAGTWSSERSLGAFAVALALSLCLAALTVGFAAWIHAIIAQSVQRHELIEQLEATRSELAEVSHLAGVAEERLRLTGEIHDTLAQSFTSIVMLLQAVEAGLPASTEETRRQVRLAEDTARAGLDDARRLLADLAPAPLEASSLPDALRRVTARFSAETGVAAEVSLAGAERPLGPRVEVALLRAAQESLANVAKHAGAAAVTVALDYRGDVALEVVDDGIGFDPAAASHGFGLPVMRERVAAVDGRVEVASAPGAGTRVAVHVP